MKMWGEWSDYCWRTPPLLYRLTHTGKPLRQPSSAPVQNIYKNIAYHRSQASSVAPACEWQPARVDRAGTVRKGRREGSWGKRNIKALGSLIGDQQDVHRWMQQAAIVLCRMMTLWFWRQKVSKSRWIRLYNAYVLPTFTYNIGTSPTVRPKDYMPFIGNNFVFDWCLLPRSYIKFLPLQLLPSWAHFSNRPMCLLATIWAHIEVTCLSSSQQGYDDLLQQTRCRQTRKTKNYTAHCTKQRPVIKISADFEALVKLAKGHELAQSKAMDRRISRCDNVPKCNLEFVERKAL